MTERAHEGSCLCGAVRYRVTGPLRPVLGCHCVQCRKSTGNYMAATAASDADLTVSDGEGALMWYRASDFASRGFCGRCGSTLFWKRDGLDATSIAAGTLDGATGLKIEAHIFCADKGDYYDIAEDAPHFAQGLRPEEA
ncbi:MAG: GFA family protein [Pseudomonadota bacterium]